MYLPLIRGGHPVRRLRIGPYMAVVITGCESLGRIQYEHVLFLFKEGTSEPCFAVASEVNEMWARGIFKTDSHFLGAFFNDSHINYGTSNDWGDLDKFTRRAIELTMETFSITETPQELSLSQAPNIKSPDGNKSERKKRWQFWK